MDLSNDLISQFVKVTKVETPKKEKTVYGTIVIKTDGKQYVKIDGSSTPEPTPIDTTVDAANGDRVIVMIKDHKAVVTGNISSPSARDSVLKKTTSKIDNYDLIVANKVDTELFNAQVARIDDLVSENVTIKSQLTADEADINTLKANNATFTEKMTAAEADIDNLEANKLDAATANAKFARIEDLEATDAKVNSLEATYGEFHDLTVSRLDAAEADIDSLEANKLDAATAEITYAKYHKQNVLWGDGMMRGMPMTSSHTANLSEAVSAQPNGIVLVFCVYNGNDDTNYSWQSFFVPKQLVALSTEGHMFTLSSGKFTYVGTKYLYINDTSITGHADNILTGMSNGIRYTNDKFVLRYVIGV